MKKRFIALLLCFSVLFAASACDSGESVVTITQPVKVAIGLSSSLDCLAASSYATEKGYELIEYGTRQAAVVAVENGKNDFVVINNHEATEEYLANTDLVWVENTEYKIEYCAVVGAGREGLLSQINGAIKSLESSGILQNIKDAYNKGIPYESSNSSFYKDKLTVLCCPVFENLIYLNEEGTLAGKELDFIWEICNVLCVEPEIRIIKEYDEMFVSLDNGEGDIIISAVEYTPELAQTHLLSEVYNETTFGVYKRK